MTKFVVCAAIAGGLLVATSVGARELTIEDRVSAQRAIEQVYWNHRIWPKENSTAKPPLSAVISDDAIRAKVDDYLRASDALGALYGASITGPQLQAEMTRMADETRDPGLLLQLFAALGNDPFVIAECLARPALADRMIRNRYARDERFHGELRRQAAFALAGATSADSLKVVGARYDEVTWRLIAQEREGDIPAASDSTAVALTENEWNARVRDVGAILASGPSSECPSPISESPGLPLGKVSPLQETNTAFYATAVIESGPDHMKTATAYWSKLPFDAWWKGQRNTFSKVWGVPASSYTLVLPHDAGCRQDSWSSIPSGVPEARASHTAVWTGVEMIVWSGGVGEYLQTGGRYNPATDTWTPTSVGANLPHGRIYHTAVWTGTEMIVWGGYSVVSPTVTRYNTGGRYNPASDTWAPTRADASTPEARYLHTAIWTGSEMIVWGGTNDVATLGTGGRYDPVTDTWRPTSTGADSSAPRRNHTAVWTGSEMIVWGWSSNVGNRYDPTTDTWRAMSTGPGVPTNRFNHTAVWTGSEMIIWGGLVGSTYSNTGGRYNPSSDTWTPTSTGANVPTAAQGMTAVWTQHEMIVWGTPSGTGARYAPLTDSWQPTSSGQGVPSARTDDTAVWTGSEMIVWGGRAPTTLVPTGTGGRYDPMTDRWTPTSIGAEIPTPRWNHTAVWTGNEMIVWGGAEDTPAVNTGGRYAPATNAWSSTSVGANVPEARREHVAVWTGREMIVWTGDGVGGVFLNSGGRYDPTTDSWRTTTTTAAPFGRFKPTAVWTGHEMIVFGGYDYVHQSQYTNTGGRYDPLLDRWRPTSVGASVPQARLYHTAVWTGNEMLVWGGTATVNTVGDRYDPGTDTWRAMGNGSGVPSFRSGHSAVWTGTAMIIFGGGANNVIMSSGARYDPVTDGWSPIDAGTSARSAHSAVWTGAEMIVWGGQVSISPSTCTNTGGRYDPVTDHWTPTNMGDSTPLPHVLHTAVWSGQQMFVWGGTPNPTSSGTYCACPNGRLVYRDADGDGFGDPGVAVASCDGSVPQGFVLDTSDCDDGNPNVHPGVPDVCNGVDDDCDGVVDNAGDALCDDYDVCTTDRCGGSAGCIFSFCNDGNPCTDDICNEGVGCVFPNNTGPCSDGNACTIGDICAGGACVSGAGSLDCDDGNPCTDDLCDPATGCVHRNNTSPCSDGNPCTANDTCSNGACVSGPAPNCDDGNPCTADSINPSCSCDHIPTPGVSCGNACTTAGTCDVTGSCLGGTRVNCDDFNPCTDDTCIPATGCQHVPNTLPCDDRNQCTKNDTCSNGYCHGTNEPNGMACDDGNSCTTNDVCSYGWCTGSALPDGSSCDDGNPCTTGELCRQGRCSGSVPFVQPLGSPRSGTTPLAVGDFNLDGYPDIVTGSTSDVSTLLVSLGNGAGGFTQSAALHLTNNDYSPFITVADFNLDGRLDIAAVRSHGAQTSVVVYLGDGAGGFASVAGTGTMSVTVTGALTADFNNDGAPDLAFAGTSGLTILLGDGHGGFVVHGTYATYIYPTDLAVGDFNGDGNLDLVGLIATTTGGVVVALGDGRGGFTAGGLIRAGDGPVAMAVGDFDADGHLDIAVATVQYSSPAIQVLVGDGHGVFRLQYGGQLSWNASSLAAADVDLDGRLDLVVGHFDVGRVSVLLGSGYAYFQPAYGSPLNLGGSRVHVALGDFDHDGRPDVLTATWQTTELRIFLNRSSGMACPQSDGCTTGLCDRTTGQCTSVPKFFGSSCNDHNVCTTNDACVAGACMGAPVSGLSCDDGNVCTIGDVCGGGSCHGGPALNCNDGNVCTDDSCNPATGCIHTNNTAPCDDRNACTVGDVCGGGTCHPGSPVICNDNNPCTGDSCNPATGCVHTNNTVPCDDGNSCTQSDTCQAGVCVGANPVSCSPLDQCHTAGTCNPDSGICSNPTKSDGAACNDGDLCTQMDNCQSGVCIGSTPVICSASDSCHLAGSCDPGTGACSNPNAPDGTTCNDGDPCTTDDACSSGNCAGTTITPPAETQDVVAAADKATYSWAAGTDATSYDAVRGAITALPVVGRDGDEVCFQNLSGPGFTDDTTPAPDSGFYYLSRAANSCGIGSWGDATSGPRSATTCP